MKRYLIRFALSVCVAIFPAVLLAESYGAWIAGFYFICTVAMFAAVIWLSARTYVPPPQ